MQKHRISNQKQFVFISSRVKVTTMSKRHNDLSFDLWERKWMLTLIVNLMKKQIDDYKHLEVVGRIPYVFER